MALNKGLKFKKPTKPGAPKKAGAKPTKPKPAPVADEFDPKESLETAQSAIIDLGANGALPEDLATQFAELLATAVANFGNLEVSSHGADTDDIIDGAEDEEEGEAGDDEGEGEGEEEGDDFEGDDEGEAEDDEGEGEEGEEEGEAEDDLTFEAVSDKDVWPIKRLREFAASAEAKAQYPQLKKFKGPEPAAAYRKAFIELLELEPAGEEGEDFEDAEEEAKPAKKGPAKAGAKPAGKSAVNLDLAKLPSAAIKARVEGYDGYTVKATRDWVSTTYGVAAPKSLKDEKSLHNFAARVDELAEVLGRYKLSQLDAAAKAVDVEISYARLRTDDAKKAAAVKALLGYAVENYAG